MKTHLVINGVNYTPYVVDGSYKMGTTDREESWQDGNMVTHKVVVASKVTGSVQIVCSEEGTWKTVDEFVADLNAATNNHVLTLLVYVPTLGVAKTIDCYFTLSNVSHIKSVGGQFTDIFELKITER